MGYTLPPTVGDIERAQWRRRKEHEFERECVKLARMNGWDCWKNENNGNKGIPDYSFLKNGQFVMVEFKREDGGGRISPAQWKWKHRHPSNVYFCDNIEEFKRIIGMS